MCSGTVVCNDIFDCIEKKSLVKESSYIYDYIPETTQKFSKIRSMSISESYELSEDGLCPKNCAQCDINKICIICKDGYDCFNDSKKTLWIVLTIVSIILIIGIGILVFFMLRNKNVGNIISLNKIFT